MKADEELVALLDLVRREGVAPKPVYSEISRRQSFGGEYKYKFRRVDSGWRIFTSPWDWDSRVAPSPNILLTEGGGLLASCKAVPYPHVDGKFVLPDGPGYHGNPNYVDSLGRRALGSGRDLVFITWDTGQALRLGVSAEETAQIYFQALKAIREP